MNIKSRHSTVEGMKRLETLLLIAGLAMATAAPAGAACFADYKAKRDNPLKLHYGVAQIEGPCTIKSAAGEIAPRVARDGWQLLNVVSVFDEAGLDQRQKSAGTFFLRY